MVGSFASIHGYHMLSSIILLNHEHTPIEVMFFFTSHNMVITLHGCIPTTNPFSRPARSEVTPLRQASKEPQSLGDATESLSTNRDKPHIKSASPKDGL